MRGVEQHLVVSVGVHGGEESAYNAEGLVQHLYHGRHAIGCARRRREDLVAHEVIRPLIDAHHQRCIDVLARSREQHAAGADLKVSRRIVAGT